MHIIYSELCIYIRITSISISITENATCKCRQIYAKQKNSLNSSPFLLSAKRVPSKHKKNIHKIEQLITTQKKSARLVRRVICLGLGVSLS